MPADTWKPSRETYLEALTDQNPWSRMGRVPEALAKTVRRPLAEVLWRTMLGEPFRYQVVLGPRRVGKTVTMYQTIQQLLAHGVPANRLWFLRLDHPLLMHFELGAWVKSLRNNFGGSPADPIYLFLDEVNYSHGWDRWLKTFFDEQWPIRVVATSSSTAILRGRTYESGIGRWNEQFLMPYSYTEYLSLRNMGFGRPKSEADLFSTLLAAIEAKHDYTPQSPLLQLFLLIGGFPELLTSLQEDDLESGLFRSQQVLRSEAVQRVAGMDIPQAFDIKHPLILERLLYVLAGQICGLMNVSKLSTELGLSRATMHQYISYLEQAYLIFTLPNFAVSEEKIQRKGRKVYFVDGAVRNAALQRGLSPISDHQEQGYLMENAVGSHLYSLSLQSGARLFHWREGHDEVDFVYGEPGNHIAFEVSRSGDHSMKGLNAIQVRYPELKGRCFLVSDRSPAYRRPDESADGVGRIPLQTFLLATGAHANAMLWKRLGIAGHDGRGE